MNIVNLKDYISDWFCCPKCKKECYGLMSWAGHTGTEHQMDCITFEQKFGVWKSFFGNDWKFFKDGKEIAMVFDEGEKVQFT